MSPEAAEQVTQAGQECRRGKFRWRKTRNSGTLGTSEAETGRASIAAVRNALHDALSARKKAKPSASSACRDDAKSETMIEAIL